MSNDLYNDLTDEEKAILKREMKHRIEQQKSREKAQASIPMNFIGLGIFVVIVVVLMAQLTIGSQPEFVFERGFKERVLLVGLIPGVLLILFGIGMWLRRQYKTTSSESRSSKNKRG